MTRSFGGADTLTTARQARPASVLPSACQELWILETAVAAGATYLVTGDKKLQRLKEYEGVLIVSPRQFLHILVAEEDSL